MNRIIKLNSKSLPELDTCRTFNESEALNYLKLVINALKKLDSFDSKKVYDVMLRLSTSYFDYYNVCIDKICELFIKSKVLDFIYNILNSLIKNLELCDKTLSLIFTLLVNYSDHSEVFAQQIQSSKILSVIIDYFLDGKMNEDTKTRTMKELIIIISNISRNPSNTVTYRLQSLKKYLLELAQSEGLGELGFIATLTLAYLVEEEEAKVLDDSVNIIKTLLEKIHHTLTTNERAEGFTGVELLVGLKCICVNDNMKRRIDEESGIEMLIGILDRNEQLEIELVLAILENLCFIDSIKRKLITNYGIRKIVSRFSSHKSKSIANYCKGIQWKIDNCDRIEYQKSASKSSFQFDVFISYCRENMLTIKDICNYLKRYNFRIWVDEEQMVGSSIEAMAAGIEDSKVIVMGMSSSYFKSTNCRREAEYAQYLNKPIIPLILELKYKPYSWLGIILGSKVYYEFSERRELIEVMKDFHKSLQMTLEAKKNESTDTYQVEKARQLCEESQSTLINGRRVDKWTTEDVLKWLENSNLGHVKKAFGNITGSLLPIMMEIRISSPEYFNGTLAKEFGMKFADVLLFHKALRALVL